jgi:O-antigen/teichoic acid export membrane protein|tara:strand:+ start:746 stop:958 length:213 start_codon:yes stop_codon:yes gene_type:complete
MTIYNDPVLLGALVFFIFLAIFWFLSKKNIESNISPKVKRLIQYGLFVLITILIVLIFQNHAAEYIRKNS